MNLNINSKFFSVGSCFASMVGSKLNQNKISCINNPFGIIYNPISIFELLSSKLNISKNLIENDGVWYNYKLHSDFRNTNKNKLIESIEEAKQHAKNQLEKSNILIITLGTAFIYKLLETNETVANCHKIPQKHFKKHLLSIDEITTAFNNFYSELNKVNPSINIIFTVSPVRHIKDTIELNSVSKSILRLACHQLQEENKNVHYFPSYEIMMDDLRDYRYYKDDLLHPTPFAENYIWDKFKSSIFDSKTLDFIEEWNKIILSLNHKPFNANSVKHQSFLKKQLEKLEKLSAEIECSEEIEKVKNEIIF